MENTPHIDLKAEKFPRMLSDDKLSTLELVEGELCATPITIELIAAADGAVVLE